MSASDQNSITEELAALEKEFGEDSKAWQKIYASMVQNSFEVGKNLQEVLTSVLESILMLSKANAGIMLLESEDTQGLVEIASNGFRPDRPVVFKKSASIGKELETYLSEDIKHADGKFAIIGLGSRGPEVGVLAIYFADPSMQVTETEQLLKLLRVHIADGIQRTRALDVVKNQDVLFKASLMQLSKTMGTTLDMKKLARQITHVSMAIVGADLCDILLIRDGSLEFQVASGFNKILKGFGNVPLKKDPAAGIVERGRAMVIKNIRSKSRFHERPWLNREQFKSYIGVPIKQGDKVIGVLEAFSKSTSRFDNSDLKILQSLSGPVAAALRNIRFFEETKKKAEELRILHTHTSRIVAVTDIGKMMKEIVDAARSAVGCLMSAAALYNPETGHFEYRTSNIDPILGEPVLTKTDEERGSYNEVAYAEILRTGKPLRLDDIKLHKESGIERTEDLPLRGFLGVPLIDQSKNPCGLVMVSFKKDGGVFTEADEEVLSTLANQASIAIQNARLYSQLEYRAKGLRNLFTVSQKISSSHDCNKIQGSVIKAVSGFFGAQSVCIALYDDDTDELRISKCLINGVERFHHEVFVIDEGKKQSLVEDKKPVLIAPCDLLAGLQIGEELPVDDFKSFLAVPLVVKNKVIGILGLSTNWSGDEARFVDELELIQIFANQVAIAIDNSRLYEEALYKAKNLSAALDFSKLIASEIDVSKIFKRVGQAIKKVFEIQRGCIFLSDRSGRKLDHIYRWGVDTDSFKTGEIYTDENHPIAMAFRNRSHIVIDDLSHFDYPNKNEIKIGEEFGSAAIIPLIVKGKVRGVIALFSVEPNFFTEERLSTISIFTNQFAVAIRNNQLYSRVVEEEIARREAELSVELLQEKAKSSIVIERTGEGIFMVDAELQIELFNPALEAMTGRKAEKVIGKKCQQVFKDIFVDGNVCDRCPINDPSKTQTDRIKANIRVNKTGEVRFVEVSHSLIDYGDKKGIVGTVRDITKDHELEIYHHDLRIATEVQKNILPHSKPTTPGLDIGFMCQPAKQIGGDYFDFIPLDNEKLGIAIGDVAGKSLPAALLVSMHKYILRSAAANTASVISPLRALNQILWEDTSPEVFVTTIYGVYNYTNSTFVYANAGHLPPLLSSGGQAKYLWSPQTPLGIQQNLFIEQQQVRLEKDDVLVLLSDGVTDIRNNKGDCFGFERLRRFVKRNPDLSAQELADRILEHTTRFSAGDLADDFTIVVLKCTKNGEKTDVKEMVVINKPIAVNDVRKFVGEELKTAGFDKNDSSDVLVSVCEAVTNSVLHGQSPDGENNNIRVGCFIQDSFFKVAISDSGIGYGPDLSAWRPPDLVRDRGRGIYLMQQLMDDVKFIARDRGATIILSKKLPNSDDSARWM
ncbi:MAG: GAF domain-containing protein [Candidatus Aquicultor sp.]